VNKSVGSFPAINAFPQSMDLKNRPLPSNALIQDLIRPQNGTFPISKHCQFRKIPALRYLLI
jgi:hypothetical protein